jgi:hypothetical protein
MVQDRGLPALFGAERQHDVRRHEPAVHLADAPRTQQLVERGRRHALVDAETRPELGARVDLVTKNQQPRQVRDRVDVLAPLYLVAHHLAGDGVHRFVAAASNADQAATQQVFQNRCDLALAVELKALEHTRARRLLALD